MSKYIIDVESDGPVPPLYSLVSIGVVVLNKDGTIKDTFYGQMRPLEGADWIPDALAVSGHTRDEHLSFPPAVETMHKFKKFIDDTNEGGRPILMSDNNQFDGGYINYYFHRFLGENPFGWTSSNLKDIFKGMEMNLFNSGKKFSRMRKTKHTHHPVDDATGNAEALLEMKKRGLNC